ncbi:MAG TPA: ATP-binding protein, partial [Pseudobdellovibrionaceae bacterium]|nr:ATP-binding protein [Pseudobdellovibrionaceae bacterium]
LRNLAENALKYSPADRPVRMVVRAGEVVVRDEGKGLPRKVRAHLGTPFNRGSTKGAEAGSSGLGLALVEAVCRRYHWAFSNEVSEGFHSCRIRFPASKNI